MSKMTVEQAKEDLLQQMRGWTAACSGPAKDYAFLERILADDWIYTDFHGVRRTKAEYLKFIDVIMTYTQEMRAADVRLLREDLALFNGVYRSTAEATGYGAMANTIDFCALWELRGGEWICLFHHTVKVPEPA